MDVDKSETTIIQENSDDSEHRQLQLPAAKFQERYAFIQEDVNTRSKIGNLPTIEAPKPDVMAFIAKLKQHPASIISEYAKAKNLPICNYFIYEIAGPQKNYICVMEYDKQQIYGCLKRSKKEAKTSGAMKLVHHLFEAGELTILDKEDKKKHPKAGVEQEDTREAFEEANPAPMVDCPPEYTTIRDEIWKRFEYEGLPDPVFCPDAERILSEAESGALNLLNAHLALTKEKFPDIIVYQAPCIRDGNKYIAGTNYEEKLIIGAISRSKNLAKQNCAAAIIDYLVRTNKFNILRKLKGKAGFEHEDTREGYEGANPAPIVDCPADFTTIRDEIWRKFEDERLPDPVFSPDTEKIISEAETTPPCLLNAHLASTKETTPEIIVYHAPCVRDGNNYIAGTNYDEKLIIGSISRSKNLAKQNCAAAVIDYLVRTNKFNIPRKLKSKAGFFEHEDTREGYEEANPAPIVDCPADYTTIRDEIWRRFEDERIPDPVFSPDTEKILSEAETCALNLLNIRLALTKEKSPDIIVYQAPCVREGNKYIAGTNYDEKLIIGALSHSKNLAKQNCAAAVIDYLVRTNKYNIPRKLKGKAGFEHEDTQEGYEEANPAPIVDCPADYTTLRNEIWRRFEDERLPDPVFSPDTEKIISEAETAPPGLLNAHLASTKEKTPEIIVYRAPCVREGNKYIAGTNYDEKLIIGALSRSKNLAKQNCAAAVIDYLVRTNKFNIPRKLKRKIEFSEALGGGGDDSPGAKHARLEALHLDLDGRTICFLSSGKSPQSILNEYCAKNRIRQAKYDIIQHGFFFKAKCIVDGIEAVSALPEASKRKAKDSAATKLIDLFVREGRFDTKKGDKSSPAMKMEMEDFEIPEFNDLKAQEYTSSFGGESIFDVTQNLVYNAVQEALETIPEMSCSSEQFAGCVLLNSNNDQATLISWATGNGYNSVSNNEGNVINDCYAEVLCRRGIVLYLLDEIQKHLESLHSIFMLDEGILNIKHEYSFHLYLSHSPNGDASRLEPIPWKFDLVFPVADYPIPHGLGQISIKSDGLNALRIHSDPMGYPPIDCSVSSSEKILKWNVCGIQGAILSKFIKPVHFNSISIGNNYDSRHVSRALYCRAKVDGQLHYPYYLNKPILVSASEKNIAFPESNEPKIFSANWNYVDETIEIINSTTGKTVANEQSRLCRLSIFSRFQQVMQSHLPQYVSMPYTKLKMESHLYVQSAITLKQSLQRNGFGVWPCKGPSASMSGIRARAPDFASDDIYS